MDGRLWRPLAQRRTRNTWSSIASSCSEWTTSSSRSLAAATALVNAVLTRRYAVTLDLGVLNNMEGIRERAQAKLAKQQMVHLDSLLASFHELVDIMSRLLHLASSMRVYAKDPAGSPVATASSEKVLEHDNGDGHGIPVFSTLNVQFLERLAEEIVTMYKAELQVKWLLASVFCSLVDSKLRLPPLNDEIRDPNVLSQALCTSNGTEVKREILEVYLACWLAEVNVKKQRVDEILCLVSEEMQVQL